MNRNLMGVLYLIPTPLGPFENGRAAPEEILRVIETLDGIIAESKKTASTFLRKTCEIDRDIPIRLLNEHTRPKDVGDLLEPLVRGERWALMSDAGCPAVADPGADLVRLAHQRGVRVCPRPGPSSILLALMASGLNGQRFAFHGYLSVRSDIRRQQLKGLESDSKKIDRTEIWIETPYRNVAHFEDILSALGGETLLCVATDLTLETEEISTRRILEWREGVVRPDLKNRPTVFLLNHGSAERKGPADVGDIGTWGAADSGGRGAGPA